MVDHTCSLFFFFIDSSFFFFFFFLKYNKLNIKVMKVPSQKKKKKVMKSNKLNSQLILKTITN